jgi:hypothetical protein
VGYAWTGLVQRVDRTRGGADLIVKFNSWERTLKLLKVELAADGYTQTSQRAAQYGLTGQRLQQLEQGQAPTLGERNKIRAYARTQGWRFP